MTTPESPFEHFKEVLNSTGETAALNSLAERYRSTAQYAELFEVLKAKIRHGMGLPIISNGDKLDRLDEATQRSLEEQLLDACREIGLAILETGQFSQAWVYLQPLVGEPAIKQAFEAAAITDQNRDDFIDTALYAGAAPESGYRLLLEHQGTCDGITFYETRVAQFPDDVQSRLSELLVKHVHTELRSSVIDQIEAKENTRIESETLEPLISKRQWLFKDCGHHLDVTHLAATVRIGRICQSVDALSLARELAQYGMELDTQLVYASESAFDQIYTDHYHYYCGRLPAEATDPAIEHFRNKLSPETPQEELIAIKEIIVELLQHSGRSTEAILESMSLELDLDYGYLMSLANCDKDFALIQDYCRDRQDLLGFGLTAIAQKNH